jgi:hypothetical protein
VSKEYPDLTDRIPKLLERDPWQPVKELARKLKVNRTFPAGYLKALGNQGYIRLNKMDPTKVYSEREGADLSKQIKQRGSSHEETLGQEVLNKVTELLARYEKYGNYLSFPYEWGERAFRGWMVYELFHEVLGWPIKNIVLGEQFDVLFVDEYVKPKLYLETKKPGKGLVDIDRFRDRIRFYGTLKYAVITDGSEWARFEISNEEFVDQMFIDAKKAVKWWSTFFMPLHARSFLYEVR